MKIFRRILFIVAPRLSPLDGRKKEMFGAVANCAYLLRRRQAQASPKPTSGPRITSRLPVAWEL